MGIDKRRADLVLQTLEQAKYLHRQGALSAVGPLREEIGSGEDVERERAEAWLAICALYKMLSETPSHQEIPERWQKAIDKTAAWVAAMK